MEWGWRGMAGNGNGMDDAESREISFAEMFRRHPTSARIEPGQMLEGRVVGRAEGPSRKVHFTVVDFGLKSDVLLGQAEIFGEGKEGIAPPPGTRVVMPLVQIENEFNEPVMDYSGQLRKPALLAERIRLLSQLARADDASPLRPVVGRVLSRVRGGYLVKILGHEAFLPKTHAIGMRKPVVGEVAPFMILKMSANLEKHFGRASPVRFQMVVSHYVCNVLSLANMIGFNDSWNNSGTGSPKERFNYLRYLTRVVFAKNPALRSLTLSIRPGGAMSHRSTATLRGTDKWGG